MAFDVEGLLGNPAFTGGLGLLAAGLDKRPVSEGLLQGLQFAGMGTEFASASQKREAQKLQNEVAREELRQLSRQRMARQQLLQEMGGDVAPGTGRGFGLLTPAEASQRRTPGLDMTDPSTIGLLAEASPELIFGESGLLAGQFDQSDGGTIMMGGQEVSLDDIPPDMRQSVMEQMILQGSDFDLSDPNVAESVVRRTGSIRQAEEALTTIELVKARAEAEKARLETENLGLKRDKVLDEGLKTALELSRTNRSLEDTVVETGGFEFTRGMVDTLAKMDSYAPEALQAALGVDTGTAKKLSGLMQGFTRLSKGQLVNQLKQLSEFDINPTDAKLSALAETTPGLGNQPEENSRNMLAVLRSLKESAQATGDWQNHKLKDEVDEEIIILEEKLGVSGTGVTINPPSGTRSEILTLPGNSTLGNFRSE